MSIDRRETALRIRPVAALPLRPGGVVTLPLVLAVGQAPRGTFREVSLEVRLAGTRRGGVRFVGARLVGVVRAPRAAC